MERYSGENFMLGRVTGVKLLSIHNERALRSKSNDSWWQLFSCWKFFSPEVCSALGRVLADPAWCHLYDSLILSRLSINYHYIWQGVINRPKCYVCAFFLLSCSQPKTKIEKFPNQYFVCFAGQWWLQWTVKHQDGARWDGSTRFNEGRTGFFSSLF